MRDIVWTDRQRECVEFSGPRLLISGPPGTGQTLVLLKRACRLSQQMPQARVLVVTFNKALAQYASDQLRLNGARPNTSAVHFHSWAARQLRDLGTPSMSFPRQTAWRSCGSR
jgi:superfamily I DNA/RNA helicase